LPPIAMNRVPDRADWRLPESLRRRFGTERLELVTHSCIGTCW